MHKARRLTRLKAASALGRPYKNGSPREVMTQGHRHAIELYQSGQTALLAFGSEFLNTIAKNAPAIAHFCDCNSDNLKLKKNVRTLVSPTDQPDTALKFALFVTNNENQLGFFTKLRIPFSTL